MDAPSRKIRIGEAAAAIGTTSKALRHWISRYSAQGVKPTAEQSGTWLEFSFGDVAALAITKYLVDLGMPAFGAFTVAMEIIKTRWPTLFDINEPKWSIDIDTALMFFYIDRDGNWGFGSFERAEMKDMRDSRVTVVASLHNIIFDAFAALREMGHSLPTCDQSQLPHRLSDRQRIVAARVAEMKRAEGALRDIETQLRATKDPKELEWMLAQLQTVRASSPERPSEPAVKPARQVRRSTHRKRK